MKNAIRRLVDWQAERPQVRSWRIEHDFADQITFQLKELNYRIDWAVLTARLQQAVPDILTLEVDKAILALEQAVNFEPFTGPCGSVSSEVVVVDDPRGPEQASEIVRDLLSGESQRAAGVSNVLERLSENPDQFLPQGYAWVKAEAVESRSAEDLEKIVTSPCCNAEVSGVLSQRSQTIIFGVCRACGCVVSQYDARTDTMQLAVRTA